MKKMEIIITTYFCIIMQEGLDKHSFDFTWLQLTPESDYLTL